MSAPFCGIYVKVGDVGYSETLALCRKAGRLGYRDLVAWSNNHARPQPDPADGDRSRALAAALTGMGWRYVIQTAYLTDMTADALGDRRILETNGDGDPECCLADPRVHLLWVEQAKRLNDWWPGAAGVLLSYDEIRRFGTHPACRAYQGRAGELLASHVRRAIADHRAVNPNWQILVWSDMFDPAENARPGDYHAVKGGWGGSWEGIDSGVVVLNWNTNGDETSEPGFRHFAALGNTQLFAGYYDGPGGDGISAGDEARLIENALEWSGGKLAGYVYTTWEGNYSRLSEYHPGELLARMAPFPSAGQVPVPPVPVPVPPVPAPDPMAQVRAALDALDEPLDSLRRSITNVKRAALKAKMNQEHAALADGIAKAKAAAGG